MIEWSPQQKTALEDIGRWMKDPSRQVYRLFGYAGTGKTTLAKTIAQGAGKNVLFGAFTGKAAVVMQKNGCAGAQTLHSMIYSVVEHDDGTVGFELDPTSAVADASLVIVDEVSMVDEELGSDLLRFGTKVLVLGDPGQLPPVRGTGFFVDAEPDMMMTDIRRQALDNPIIQLSMLAREGQPIPRGTYGESRVIDTDELAPDDVINADQVIVGTNKKRQLFNRRIRSLIYEHERYLPVGGDRMICLRNNKNKGLLNGSLWEWVDGERCAPGVFPSGSIAGRVRSLDLDLPDAIKVEIPLEFFVGDPATLDFRVLKYADQFDYGYAITAHKSQGSQFGSVMVFDESRVFRDMAHRWLYTAITRAAERVDIVQF